MKNLFQNSIKSTVLPPGSYSVVLVSVRQAPPLKYGEAVRDRVTFCFKTTKGDVPVNRTVTGCLDSRGKLAELLRQMAGHELPETVFTNGERLTKYIEGFLGNIFNARIAPSKNGRFNNILSLSKEEV